MKPIRCIATCTRRAYGAMIAAGRIGNTEGLRTEHTSIPLVQSATDFSGRRVDCVASPSQEYHHEGTALTPSGYSSAPNTKLHSARTMFIG